MDHTLNGVIEKQDIIEGEDDEEQMTLIEKLCDSFIVETDDDVYYDAEKEDEDVKELVAICNADL